MSKKFTEEQYRTIVEISYQYHDDRVKKTDVLLSYMYDDFGFKGGEDTQVLDQALALANPLTRELAHNKYVEKEKKYVWSSKKADRDNNVLTLYIDNYGMVSTSYRKVYENNLRNENMLITESEIREWGYNPEMFDKEEV